MFIQYSVVTTTTMTCHPACDCISFPLRPVEAQSLATCWAPATTSVLEVWFTTRSRQEVPGLLLLPLLLTGSYEGRCIYLKPGPELICSVPERLNPSTRAPGCPWCRVEVQRKVINGGSLISLAHAASQSTRVRKPELISVNRATELLQVTTPRGRISLASWFAKEANRWMSSRVLPKTFIRHVLKLLHACRMECPNLRCDHRRGDHVLVRRQDSRILVSQSSQPQTWTLQMRKRGWECVPVTPAATPRPAPVAPSATTPASSSAPVRATQTAQPPVRALASAPVPEPKPQVVQGVPAQQPPSETSAGSSTPSAPVRVTQSAQLPVRAPLPALAPEPTPQLALVQPRLNPKAGAKKAKRRSRVQEPLCITLDKSR